MKIIFVRHGQTDYNKNGHLAGQLDPPINQKGEFQATKVGIALSDIKFDKVYCSDLKRAQQTCRILLSQNKHISNVTLSDKLDSLVCIDKLLREQSFGEFEGKKVKLLKRKQKLDKDFLPVGGESKEDVFNRAVEFFENLCHLELTELENEKFILVVGHGIFFVLLFRFFNTKYGCQREYLKERILNASRSCFEITFPTVDIKTTKNLNIQCQYYNETDYKGFLAYHWFKMIRFLWN